MSTSTLVTADELFQRSGDGCRYELIAGELIMMSPSGWRHGEIVGNLHTLLGNYVRQRNLGSVFGAETGFRLARNPDTVRAPDIAFIAKEHWPSKKPTEAYWPGGPDLAVEVLSPSDSPNAVADKTKAWMSAGTVVWIVDPENESVSCHVSPNDLRVFAAGEQLLGEPVVLGFVCEIDEIFS